MGKVAAQPKHVLRVLESERVNRSFAGTIQREKEKSECGTDGSGRPAVPFTADFLRKRLKEHKKWQEFWLLEL